MATFCLNYTIVSVYEFRNDLCKSHTLGLRMAGNIACFQCIYKDHNIVIAERSQYVALKNKQSSPSIFVM